MKLLQEFVDYRGRIDYCFTGEKTARFTVEEISKMIYDMVNMSDEEIEETSTEELSFIYEWGNAICEEMRNFVNNG